MEELKFKIKVYYTTGDSFNTHNAEDELDGNFNLATAKENIKRIKEHYLKCNEDRKLCFDDSVKLFLINDSGLEYQMNPFWMGCFESLNKVEIIIDQTDMIWEP